MIVVICLPAGAASDENQLGAEIFNQCRNSKKEQSNNEEPNEAHSPHHSERHISYLHHIQRPPLIRARSGPQEYVTTALSFS